MKETMETSSGWVARIAALQDRRQYEELNWEGSFEDYLRLVEHNPKVTRTAYQRLYDMILSHGKTEYIDNKKRLIRYHFFSDEKFGGRDAIYGLDVPLMKLVNVFKSAAQGYGTEKRVILLHGPVGSSKSTIARLMKKGLEEYSKTPEGAAYTFSWFLEKGTDGHVTKEKMKCPMNEEPLNLIPREWRPRVFAELAPPEKGFQIPDGSELCPACRFVFRDLMNHSGGDFQKVVSQHVRVHRLIFSEKDRIGVGTFQPKDEKNQDSTELTGDINYRKIYEKDFNAKSIKGKHIAPHSLEMAAMWAVLTRLEEPKKHNLSVTQKLKLYNGKTLPNFTEDNIKELRKEAAREGLDGISPRYIQDKISNALVSDKGEGCINPFMVLNELEAGLKTHSLIPSEEARKRYRELLTSVKQEYEDIVKNEVQRAISADEDAIGKLCGNYIDN